MSRTIRSIPFLLALMACGGHSRRVQTSIESLKSEQVDDGHQAIDASSEHVSPNTTASPLRSLATLFQAFNPTSAFNLHSSAGRVSERQSNPGVSSVQPRASAPMAVDDKAVVKEYFNNEGFNRWSRIYSEDAEVNAVQLDIREGHAVTVDKVLKWVDADETAKNGESFGDVGCGVGSLALPLAQRGATVNASDISAAMVEEATKRAASAGVSDRTTFNTNDLESLEGSYDTVTCIDVMIHYPQEKMAEMVQGLATHAKRRLIVSFAPDTWYYRLLKKIGELAPGPSKTTRAYLHSEDSVVGAIEKAGFNITRTEMTGTKFYFSRLLEAQKLE